VGRPAEGLDRPVTVRLVEADSVDHAERETWRAWEPERLYVDCPWCGDEARAVTTLLRPERVPSVLSRGYPISLRDRPQVLGFEVEPCGHVVSIVGMVTAREYAQRTAGLTPGGESASAPRAGHPAIAPSARYRIPTPSPAAVELLGRICAWCHRENGHADGCPLADPR
jgi:hypothetical protein